MFVGIPILEAERQVPITSASTSRPGASQATVKGGAAALIASGAQIAQRLGKVLSGILLFGFLPTIMLADVQSAVRELDGTAQVFVAGLQGEIGANDLDALVLAVAAAPPASMKTIVLNSEGGDLSTAMEIGRLVRKMRFDVVIPRRGQCLSACVFILAAGIDKHVQGPVGIHRPYFADTDVSSPAAAIKATKAEVEAYFAEMNIPTRLAEDMFSIDPADMQILSAAELRDYRLNSMDYAEREAQAVTSAEQYGLSRQDYEAFRDDLNYSCQIVVADPAAFKACATQVAVKHGVALPPGWNQ